MRVKDDWLGGCVDYWYFTLNNVDNLRSRPVVAVESWSSRVVSISIDSPGRIILFVFIDIRLYLLFVSVLWFVTGNVASTVVAGTVFLLCSNDMVLFVKF